MNKARSQKEFLDSVTMGRAGVIKITGENKELINSLEYDSRNVKEGSLYFALTGLHTDGHNYIKDAVKNGAKIIVHEKVPDTYIKGIIYIMVKNSRFAMSPIASSFYGHPSQKLKVIGVTGTEGKSTSTYLIYQLLILLGKKTGFISTVQRDTGNGIEWNTEHQTTPEATIVHKLLAEMCGNSVEYAVIESSSHGLSKKTNRLGDVDFYAGVMTNVNHDHLEFHGSWEQYRSDKAELFRGLKSFGIINADDPSAEYFANAGKTKSFSFSTRGMEADLYVKLSHSTVNGSWYEIYIQPGEKKVSARDNLPGAFNTGNVLCAILTVSKLLSIQIEELAPLIPLLKPVRGRMNRIVKGQPFEVLVDYAHTPSSFETVIPPLKERLDAQGGRLIVLFGSAGERDTEKRPLQGKIAAEYSDIIILTDEDPRGEDPMSILEMIAEGTVVNSKIIKDETLFLIPNRPAAIRKAFSLAKKGDTVLLLGKGHENSIIYESGTIEYDEIEEAEKALAEASYSSQS